MFPLVPAEDAVSTCMSHLLFVLFLSLHICVFHKLCQTWTQRRENNLTFRDYLKIIQLSFTFGNIMFCHLIYQAFDLEIKQRNA